MKRYKAETAMMPRNIWWHANFVPYEKAVFNSYRDAVIRKFSDVFSPAQLYQTEKFFAQLSVENCMNFSYLKKKMIKN